MLELTLNEIFTAAKKVPAASRILTEVFGLLDQVDADVDEISALLRQDGALAGTIIRISNSAHYGGGGIGSVEQAIQRVGFSEIHRLVGCAAVGNFSDRSLECYQIDAEALREHMVCTALAAEALASLAGINSRNAYTSGLLRPIGMIVLDRLARDKIAPEDRFDLERDGNYGAWERNHVQLTNAPVTGVTLNEWNFAYDVVEAVRGHTLVTVVNAPTRQAYLLNVAGWMAQELGQGLPGERNLWDLTSHKLEVLGLREEQVTEKLETVAALFEHLQPALV